MNSSGCDRIPSCSNYSGVLIPQRLDRARNAVDQLLAQTRMPLRLHSQVGSKRTVKKTVGTAHSSRES
jgi:hypothetical protein